MQKVEVLGREAKIGKKWEFWVGGQKTRGRANKMEQK
jgi:hypothetical protein